jgi:transposase-like protein
MTQKKTKSVRNSFSPEIRAKALRLMAEDGYTLNQTAAEIGCSVAALQNWKKADKEGTWNAPAVEEWDAEVTTEPAKKTKKVKRRKKAVKKATVVPKATMSFEDFVRDYWRKNAKASDVLLLPPEIAPEAVRHTNDVLRYAYEQFCK